MKKFGTIEIKLKEVLELKGITRCQLAKAIHVCYLNVLSKICYVLECSPKDILNYENFNSPNLPEDF